MTSNQPLAERMRPSTLEEYIGQQHLVAKGAILRNAIESGALPSFILWGPPGVGKTTLARIIAKKLNRPFIALSAVNSGVKEVREAIDQSKRQQYFTSPNTILFIDEIHRFSKSQQDSLLSAVEDGTITLIGATTENPSFEVISPLLSRCQVYVLKSLNRNELNDLLVRALRDDLYLKRLKITVEEDEALFRYSGGDGRKLLNILELVVSSSPTIEQGNLTITNELVTKNLQQKIALYDKDGEQHYDIISAFIKSIRGSDPNAAVYWLARMVEGGEDPKFIARRLIILAAEDVGLANPNALLLATTCFEAVNMIGWPESRIILSEATIYLANSPKSNAAYMAINEAQLLVKKTGDLPVPLQLRNAPTALMDELGYGKEYKYAHDFDQHFVDENYLPEAIAGTRLYTPQNNPQESKVQDQLTKFWSKRYKY